MGNRALVLEAHHTTHIEGMQAVLKQLLGGKGQQAERTLKNRFAAWWRSLRGGGLKHPVVRWGNCGRMQKRLKNEYREPQKAKTARSARADH
jgi:hypothetical protein